MARVLVVDDDPAVRDLVAEYLTARGHEVLRAVNGVEAREVLERERVGVVVTDLQMPVLDGLGVLAYVRDHADRLPVIIVSGSWTPGQRQVALGLGAVRVYSKPVDLERLARDVEELAR